ncbi:hypothetical protein H4R18_004812 [Coemansia javaensis]|uniref:Uncharacterized protein n=1 Tax=Coemansia javaensis TaxID=2761396 RepID=A0A9W8H7Z8_9FUNG|nr:hypothetical protein H4R18_004812 [Coemansia javaensis]
MAWTKREAAECIALAREAVDAYKRGCAVWAAERAGLYARIDELAAAQAQAQAENRALRLRCSLLEDRASSPPPSQAAAALAIPGCDGGFLDAVVRAGERTQQRRWRWH